LTCREGYQRFDVQSQIQFKSGGGALYDAVADGTVSDTALLKDTLGKLESQRDESMRLQSLLDVDAPPLRRALSKAQALVISGKLRRGLLDAPAPLQRRYVRGLVSNIVVGREKAVISGPKAAIAAAVTTQPFPAKFVLLFENGAPFGHWEQSWGPAKSWRDIYHRLAILLHLVVISSLVPGSSRLAHRWETPDEYQDSWLGRCCVALRGGRCCRH
jgi:hypothetical protein